jgi:predicted DNA-binding protein (MmcQ/YjbR family)
VAVVTLLRHAPGMTYEELLAVCLRQPGAWQDSPWEEDLVVKAGPKIFVFPREDAVTLKVQPEAGDALRATYPDAVDTPPYLNKRLWVRIRLDGTVPDAELTELVQESYRLVVNGLTKAQRAALG